MAVCPPPSSKRKSGNTKSEISKNFQHLFSWEPGYVKFIGGGNRLFHTTLFMYFVIVILKTILWQKFSLNIFTKFYSIPESFQNPITFLWKLQVWICESRGQMMKRLIKRVFQKEKWGPADHEEKGLSNYIQIFFSCSHEYPNHIFKVYVTLSHGQ